MKNKPLLYVTLFSAFWAFSIVLTKFVINLGVHPFKVTTQALFVSSIILSIYVFGFNKQNSKIAKKTMVGILISGIIGGGLANYSNSYGLKLTTAINAGFLIKTATAFTVTFAYFFLKEPVNRIKGLFVVILLFGAYLLTTNGKLISPHYGDIFILLAAMGYAIASIINRKVIRNKINPDLVSFYRAFMGFITSFLLSFWVVNVFEFEFPLLIFLIGTMQSLIYLYLNKTLQVASASYMTMMSMMTPVIVALIAVPLFHEKLSVIQWTGAILVVLAGIMTQVKGLANHK